MYCICKKGRENAHILKPVSKHLQLLCFKTFKQELEESSEIASARESSVGRKSMKKPEFVNREFAHLGSRRNLSRISEEETENKSAVEKHEVEDKVDDDNVGDKVNDVSNQSSDDMIDEKQINDKHFVTMRDSCVVSRFVPVVKNIS